MINIADIIAKYSDSQERDAHGKFGGGGSGGATDSLGRSIPGGGAPVTAGALRDGQRVTVTSRDGTKLTGRAVHDPAGRPMLHVDQGEHAGKFAAVHETDAVVSHSGGSGASVADRQAESSRAGARGGGMSLADRQYLASKKSLADVITENGGDLPLDLMTVLPPVEKADLPRAAYAYAPEDDTATWKLPLWDDSSGPSAAAVGRAVAAIGKGFRGQKVQIPAADLAGVKAKIRAAWKKTHDDSEEPPDVLKATVIERLRDALRKDNPDSSDVHVDSTDLTDPHTHVHDHGDGPHSHAHRHVQGEMDDHTSHPPMTLKSVQAFTKSSDERRFTLGPQYVPDKVDAHGEFATAQDLQDAVHEYVKSGDRRIFKQHTREVIGEWVEMMSWPHEVEVDLQLPDGVKKSRVTLPAGTVFMGVEWTEKAWPDLKWGKISGYSMGGYAHRIDVEMA